VDDYISNALLTRTQCSNLDQRTSWQDLKVPHLIFVHLTLLLRPMITIFQDHARQCGRVVFTDVFSSGSGKCERSR
jgi:hypothetical protein